MGRLFRRVFGGQQAPETQPLMEKPPEAPPLMEKPPEAPKELDVIDQRFAQMDAAYDARKEHTLKPNSPAEDLYRQYRLAVMFHIMPGHFKAGKMSSDQWRGFVDSRPDGLKDEDKSMAEAKFGELGLVDKRLESYRRAVDGLDKFLKQQGKKG